MPLKSPLTTAIDAVEVFFDRLKLGAKWRFDLWKDLRILPYAGYGTPDRYHLRGRVLDDEPIEQRDDPSTLQNIRDLIHRLETDEIPNARVRITHGDRTWEVETDRDGFFELDFEPGDAHDPASVWQTVTLTLLAPTKEGETVEAEGRVFVPQAEAEFAVLSDVDDTVIRTGATDRLKMIRTVLLNNASSRVPFPGVGALYRAFAEGPDGEGRNPVFYVSSSPYNLYDLFERFLDVHDLPEGPIFLKDFGFEPGQFMKSGHAQHKLDHIDRLVETYPDLPFVLFGDSGQKDPEIYREAVRRHADSLCAVFLRDVTPNKQDARDEEVQALAEEMRDAGVPTFLVASSEEAARHARKLGLVPDDAPETVREDAEREARQHDEPEGVVEKAIDTAG